MNELSEQFAFWGNILDISKMEIRPASETPKVDRESRRTALNYFMEAYGTSQVLLELCQIYQTRYTHSEELSIIIADAEKVKTLGDQTIQELIDQLPKNSKPSEGLVTRISHMLRKMRPSNFLH